MTKTLEKLRIGGGLVVDFLIETFDLLVVSIEVGVSERRLVLFCSPKDFSDNECSTPKENE